MTVGYHASGNHLNLNHRIIPLKQRAASAAPPNPEVPAKANRRRFTAEYKLRILQEADQCMHGDQGALLRREGLYSSHLRIWRDQRDRGQLEGLAPRKRGRKGPDPLLQRMAELEKENARLKDRLHKAEIIIDVQKKVSGLLGIPLRSPDNDENG